jgi:hypothetical protein
MKIRASSIKWAMLVSGCLTCTMIYATFAPYAALQSNFGRSLDPDPLADLVVRNWGALIALVGFMLVYGAFETAVRTLVLSVAIVSKAIFVGLVLSQAEVLFQGQARIAVLLDSIMIALFGMFLISILRPSPSDASAANTTPRKPVAR